MTVWNRFLALGLSAALALPIPASRAADTPEPVGTVKYVKTYAYGTPPGGQRAPKFAHHDVYRNELIETVRTGGLEAEFEDGTRLVLSGSSSLVIDEYVYDPDAKDQQSALYNLARGTFFYATGKMNKHGIELTTPVATIGIRGTELVIEVGADGQTKVGVVSGAARVTSLRDKTSWEAGRGGSISVDREGRVSNVKTGVDKTGVEEIDREIPDDIEKPEKEDRYKGLREEDEKKDEKGRKDKKDGEDGKKDGEGDGKDGRKDGKDQGDGEGQDRGDRFGSVFGGGEGDGQDGGDRFGDRFGDGGDQGDNFDREFFSDGFSDDSESGFDDGESGAGDSERDVGDSNDSERDFNDSERDTSERDFNDGESDVGDRESGGGDSGGDTPSSSSDGGDSGDDGGDD